LIAIARPLYTGDPIGIDLDAGLYALDSTTIDLCLSLFPWARFTPMRANACVFLRIAEGPHAKRESLL
jgi:hypothetical protein